LALGLFFVRAWCLIKFVILGLSSLGKLGMGFETTFPRFTIEQALHTSIAPRSEMRWE
jgi:hypothetical protein